jgi:hypothetical protein
MTNESNRDTIWPITGGVSPTGKTAAALAKLLQAAGEAPALVLSSRIRQQEAGVSMADVLTPEESSKVDALLRSASEAKPIILGQQPQS